MSLDLINISPSELLNLLKSAYYEQTGETIQIGSDEFATAATQSYVWSVLLNDINNATQNRFIDTATGSFLDAIAANYGIYTRPNGYHSTTMITLTLTADGITIPANAVVIQDSQGNQFTNPYEFYASTGTGSNYALFQAVDAGSKYNGIPIGELTEIVSGGEYITAAVNETMTAGGTDGFPYTTEGDNAYREWLKTEIQSFAGAGTYQAYEARAKNADSRVLGVYVLKQTDDGYQKGKVKIYIYTDSDFDQDSQVLHIVQNSCADPSFRPIGDLVEVSYSPLTEYDISVAFQVTYPQRFAGVANTRTERIYHEYCEVLERSINKPFSFEEFCSLIVQKDVDGVFALDCKPLEIDSDDYPDPVYPEIGGRINPRDITFDYKYTSGV